VGRPGGALFKDAARPGEDPARTQQLRKRKEGKQGAMQPKPRVFERARADETRRGRRVERQKAGRRKRKGEYQEHLRVRGGLRPPDKPKELMRNKGTTSKTLLWRNSRRVGKKRKLKKQGREE